MILQVSFFRMDITFVCVSQLTYEIHNGVGLIFLGFILIVEDTCILIIPYFSI